MNNKLTAVALAAAIASLSACDSDDDDDGGAGPAVTPPEVTSEAGTFQVTFTNLTANQLMTPPVVALHAPGTHLYQVGETAEDAVRDIAETGNNDALVAFALANPEVVSAAGVAGDGPFGPGGSVTTSLTTAEDGQVFSAVNMVICTNDAIRDNSSDAQSFFPPPCYNPDGEVEPTAETDPRAPIAAHPGQTVPNDNPNPGAPIAPDNWDVAAGAEVLQIEIVRN